MAYTVDDFAESLARVRLAPGAIARVVSACGHSPEGYASWAGAFVLLLRDGRLVALTGWCDTTGWGCQDVANLATLDVAPPAAAGQLSAAWLATAARVSSAALLAHASPWIDGLLPDGEQWDAEPADLNRWLGKHAEGSD